MPHRPQPCRTGHFAPTSQKLGSMRRLEPYPQLDADFFLNNVYALDCIARRNDSLQSG